MPDEAGEISDEDVEIKEQGEAATRILGGMENMTNSLLELSAQAEKDKMEVEQRTIKRPRKAAPVEMPDAPMPAKGAGPEGFADALQPSGAPHFTKPGQ